MRQLPANPSAVEAEQQRRRDILFLVVLLALVTVATAQVVRTAYPPRPVTVTVAGGEIRPVAPAVLQQQLRSGRLSDREAEFYRPASTRPQPAATQRSRPRPRAVEAP